MPNRSRRYQFFSLGTIPIHLYEVQSTIEATIDVGVIHCVCELIVLQVEALVGIIIWHQLLGCVNMHIFDGNIDARWLEVSKRQGCIELLLGAFKVDLLVVNACSLLASWQPCT